jgi:hypothetical protein
MGGSMPPLGDGTIRWHAAFDVAGGDLSAAGDLGTGAEPAWAIRDGSIRRLDFAALLGDTYVEPARRAIPSRWPGDFPRHRARHGARGFRGAALRPAPDRSRCRGVRTCAGGAVC